ncbi:nucleotidyltransferase family protein [Pseudarthrobacter sulfonivorans]|uniref:nucleotidyltransferase family protein n=1 Tax=Pseudarthrobacter sulfonivorans TaxID=121292 RepID=UPI0021078E27|nr:nucleotidyltransferase family protein [Pseudarthrobacter sulfonivorans]
MEDEGTDTQLNIPEAVLLGHAMVQRVANGLGIRAFFIKGPASVVQGLRMPKTSGDVDVFVHPADLESMVGGLQERGWRERPVDLDSLTFPKHSVTVHHPEWPCCIDVHYRFPGMENAPEDSYEVMWANTEVLGLAGQGVRVPAKELGILLLALHALRSPHLLACNAELRFLAELTEREAHAPAILDLAQATGSLAAVRPFLGDLLAPNVAVEWPEASTEWRNRVLAKEPGSARLIAIAQAPWQDKPGMLFRAVFPAPEVHLSRDIYADMSLRGRLKSHRARWSRFLHSAPHIVRDLRRRRHGG